MYFSMTVNIRKRTNNFLNKNIFILYLDRFNITIFKINNLFQKLLIIYINKLNI